MSTAKTVAESRTTHVEILMPGDLNGYSRLFGGKLMEWIDVVAGVVARRHAGREVTTASVDNLEFQAPAYVNDTIVLEGRITCVGRTSMEVRVDTFVEELGGTRHQVNRAYLVMVALDRNQKPAPVPELILETEEDHAEWDAGLRRRELRRTRQKENY
ncbi:MAG: acyl-CoA thioesterase [Clostridiales bacterium]|nr:acyl-CoA thioesterase [Clostridiales bacterium]